MILTLEVVGHEGDRLGLARRKIFSTTGGTIGRLKGNTWTLAEGHVSGRHAVIRFRDGQFLIEDTSTNGTCLNSPTNKLEKGRLYPLAPNDLILIDPFEIRVTIEAGVTDSGPVPAVPQPGPASPLDPPLLEPVSELVDPMQVLGFGPSEKSATPNSARPKPVDVGARPPHAEAFVPPRVVPAPEPDPEPPPNDDVIPEWDFINDRPVERPGAKAPQSPRGGEARPVGPYPRPTPGPRRRRPPPRRLRPRPTPRWPASPKC